MTTLNPEDLVRPHIKASMTDKLPADWALRVAAVEVGFKFPEAVIPSVKATPSSYATLIALARRIEKTDQPPIEPLLLEAREIVAKYYEDANGPYNVARIRSGEWDSTNLNQIALAALKRGMELAK